MFRKASKKHSLKSRMEIINFLGGKCVKCGFDKDYRAFQIDHINGGGVTKIKSFKSRDAYYQHIIESEAKGYQLLCANCNQIKRIENEEHQDYYKNRML